MTHPGSKKVLVIDDEQDMLDVVEYTLKKAGYQVATCDNGRQAVATMREVQPDLVILDVMLPGTDGYTLGLQISQDETLKSIPIIVMTALEPSKALFQKFSQVKGFITKPFKGDNLIATVEGIIGKSERLTQ